MANIFERGTKQKVRFSTSKGEISIEEVWDLSLTSIDKIAQRVNAELKDSSTESFISDKTPVNTGLTLKLDILKRIIEVKLAARDAKAARAERTAKIARLKELAATKSDEALASQSLEDIQKTIAELEGEESAE